MKKRIALVAGGYSGESVVSLATADNILNNIDKDLYEVYLIIIEKNSWHYNPQNGNPIEVDKNDFSITIDHQHITFDLAFIAIHGTPGEDGKLQGYFDLIGLPYSSCNALVSAMTFNKSFCNNYLRSFNIVNIAHSVPLNNDHSWSLGTKLEALRFPVFVKPNESGSSIGVSKVETVADVLPAIEKAFKESSSLLIEEFISGTELTVGVYRDEGMVKTLPITEVISKNAFFDYEAKYKDELNQEITPARVSDEVKMKVDKAATAIYQTLNCRGLVRIDFILEKETEELYFLEVNTVPGQTNASLVPKAIVVGGMDLKTFYGNLIEASLA